MGTEDTLWGFSTDAVCLALRGAAASTVMLLYSLARREGCCCWMPGEPQGWLDAAGLLAEEAGLEYRGSLLGLAAAGCGAAVLGVVEEAARRLGLSILDVKG